MRFIPLAFVATTGWIHAASATVTTFNVAGTFSNGQTLSGFFAVDDSRDAFYSEIMTVQLTVDNAGIFDVITYGSTTSKTTLHPFTVGVRQSRDTNTLALGFMAYTDGGFGILSIPDGDLITFTVNPTFATYVTENSSNVYLASGTISAATAVPEPASLALLSMGVAGIVAARRKRST